MPDAISDTSPLVYLYRIEVLDWLPRLFSSIWIPPHVVHELDSGRARGYAVPDPRSFDWLTVVEPMHLPAEWFALDLGVGEVAAMALALEHPERTVVLDDLLARRTAQAAALNVWGTLRVLLQAKEMGLTADIGSHLRGLKSSDMFISDDVRQRILHLAGE